MNLTSLLSQILGDYKQHGNGECYFLCPFCHHRNHKFAVNVTKNMFHCWHCSAKGRNLITLFKRLDVSPAQMKELRALVSDEQLRNYKDIDSNTKLYLPPGFTPLWTPNNTLGYRYAKAYLDARNISQYDIIRYQMGYTMEGLYAQRVIIPSYDNTNTLNYFIARSFFENKLKYMNPPVSKNVVMFENQINWKVPVVLVEGAFDAITVRRNAIPLNGKHLPKKVLKAIIQHQVKDIYVALDDDARIAAMELERTLSTHNINVKLVELNGKDPSEIGFTDTWARIEQGHSTSLKNYISERLSTI